MRRPSLDIGSDQSQRSDAIDNPTIALSGIIAISFVCRFHGNIIFIAFLKCQFTQELTIVANDISRLQLQELTIVANDISRLQLQELTTVANDISRLQLQELTIVANDISRLQLQELTIVVNDISRLHLQELTI